MVPRHMWPIANFVIGSLPPAEGDHLLGILQEVGWALHGAGHPTQGPALVRLVGHRDIL